MTSLFHLFRHYFADVSKIYQIFLLTSAKICSPCYSY